jgi:hypothetical protein
MIRRKGAAGRRQQRAQRGWVFDEHWPPGAHVALRSIWQGWVWFAFPAVVVCDSTEFIALWTPSGSHFKGAIGPDGRSTRLPFPNMRHADLTVRDGGLLRLARPGAAHDVWARWSPVDGRFTGWKVNLQAPLRRSRIGFDTLDHLLDLVVAPDLRSWHWKDADELDQAVAQDLFSADMAAAIRAEGERALAAIQSRSWPYSGGWEDWSPLPTWTTPELPVDWDVQ